MEGACILSKLGYWYGVWLVIVVNVCVVTVVLLIWLLLGSLVVYCCAIGVMFVCLFVLTSIHTGPKSEIRGRAGCTY